MPPDEVDPQITIAVLEAVGKLKDWISELFDRKLAETVTAREHKELAGRVKTLEDANRFLTWKVAGIAGGAGALVAVIGVLATLGLLK